MWAPWSLLCRLTTFGILSSQSTIYGEHPDVRALCGPKNPRLSDGRFENEKLRSSAAPFTHTITAVRRNLRLLDGRRVYKIIFPVIHSTSPAPAQTYPYCITMEVHMKYALIILRYGNVFTHPRFRETFSDPGGSLITRDLSIALPVPSRTHVLLYSKIYNHKQFSSRSTRHSVLPHAVLTCATFPSSPLPWFLKVSCTYLHHFAVSLRCCATTLPLLSCTCLSCCTRCNITHFFSSVHNVLGPRFQSRFTTTSVDVIDRPPVDGTYIYRAYPLSKDLYPIISHFKPSHIPPSITVSPRSGPAYPGGTSREKGRVETFLELIWEKPRSSSMRFHVRGEPF